MEILVIFVDGTDFRILQWKPFWKGWYSFKFKGPGVRYEVALCIRTGDIVWINGPFPCGKNPDIVIFRYGLKHALAEGEKAEADAGYKGEGAHIVLPRPGDAMQTRVRSRQETVNKRFKQWGCLKRVFRHRVEKHQDVFGAVAVITQLILEHEQPLFACDDYRS